MIVRIQQIALLVAVTGILAACGGGSAAKPTPDARPTSAVIVSTATAEATPSATLAADACRFVPPDNFSSAFSNPAIDYGAKGRDDGIGIVFTGKDATGAKVEFAIPLCARAEALHAYNVANGKQ